MLVGIRVEIAEAVHRSQLISRDVVFLWLDDGEKMGIRFRG